MTRFFFITGIIFLIYFLAIALFLPHGTAFFVIWLAAALFCFAVSFLRRRKLNPLAYLPGWLRKLLIAGTVTGAALFLFVEGCIVSRFWDKGPENLDYIIVLGAQIKETGPSPVLQMRLDAAYDYLQANPATQAILSGGQGPDEPVTEAQGMYDYLVARGIPPERLIKEDQSANTHQNLTFSGAYLTKETDTVGIVTNNFHVFRARKLAEKAGYQNSYGIAAPSDIVMQANNMVREFLGIIKDFLVGNL